jgi:hypothetical protein
MARMGLAGLACAILSLALAANDGSLSGWRYIPLERKNGDGWVPRSFKAKDFHDTRFEYRWKSERNLDRFACTIEIRPTDDVDQHDTIPEITVYYYDPSNFTPGHFRVLTAREVSLGKANHAFFKPQDCREIESISWHTRR